MTYPSITRTSAMLATLTLLSGMAVGETAKQLPPPRTDGGMPLMEALAKRQSRRELASTPLPDELVSSLLWAAAGVNRPESGKRTAPSAINWQGIDVYVARPEGLDVYQPREHALSRVMDEDVRPSAGKQPFVQEAPLVLIYVANADRMPRTPRETAEFYSATDTGFISQNVYLFCAAHDLATVVVGWLDKTALGERMNLEEHQRVILTQPVGYPAGHPNADEPVTETPETAALRDGTYRAAARGYVDDITVEVTVERGRLTAVNVLQHRENRPGRALDDLPARLVAAQTPDAVDAVTGATATSEALKNAVRGAIEKAR